MKKHYNVLTTIYFAYGGLLLLSSAIGFVYCLLFNIDATVQQWAATFILGVVGAIFMLIADDRLKRF